MTTVPAFARVAQETITVNFNNIRVAINGQVIQTEGEPFVHNGRTYLPMRDIAEAMNFNVTWEDATNTVHLTSRTNPGVPNYPPHNSVTPVPSIGTIPPNTPVTPVPPIGTTPPQPAPTPAPTPAQGNRNNRPTNPPISLERAIEIAYEDLAARNITASFRTHSGMDWERNQWVWELEFRPTTGRGVIEYYINVNTGVIVKFEWDR